MGSVGAEVGNEAAGEAETAGGMVVGADGGTCSESGVSVIGGLVLAAWTGLHCKRPERP